MFFFFLIFPDPANRYYNIVQEGEEIQMEGNGGELCLPLSDAMPP